MKRHTHHNQQGLGLVEILVAVGIFLVGITALVRIFPAGLSSVDESGRRTTAAKLVERIHSYYEANPDHLPEAVVYVNDLGQIQTSVDPETTPEDGPGNALEYGRMVIGERHTADSSGAIYLRQAPVYQTTGSDGLSLYQWVPLGRSEWVPGASNLMLNVLDGVTAGATYRVSYSFEITSTSSAPAAATPHGVHVQDLVVVSVAAGTDTTLTLQIPPGASDGTVQLGSISISRRESVTPSGPASVVIASPADPAAAPYFNSGIITGLTPGAEIYADYSVPPNGHWMTEFVRTGPIPAGVTPPEIPAGSGIPATSQLNLLFGGTSDAGAVYVADSTPNVDHVPAGDPGINGSHARTLDGDIDGTVYSLSAVGTMYRVSYRTYDEWDTQIQRVPKTFQPYMPNAPTVAQQPWREYADRLWRVSGSLEFTDTNDRTTLGFPACWAGGTVVVDYVYDGDGDEDRDGVIRGEMHTIPAVPNLTPVYDNDTDTSNGSPWAHEIQLYHNYVEILAVRGVSYRVRALWNSDGLWRQVAVPGHA